MKSSGAGGVLRAGRGVWYNRGHEIRVSRKIVRCACCRGDVSDVYRLRGGYAERWTVFWLTAHFLNAAAEFKEMGVCP